eukprot:CAMPEP_0177703898 /NCGR_PEP_ID=MMETSP0484_2-20121128/7914_1 /TAXON_ID=354590 /ORGANISM="Rhodomonas lens, Strain RHODO" /LENGTH=31 /DNA_ID= /DNA_START= /DNA_END= /DNA_ORIENTATION=
MRLTGKRRKSSETQRSSNDVPALRTRTMRLQ